MRRSGSGAGLVRPSTGLTPAVRPQRPGGGRASGARPGAAAPQAEPAAGPGRTLRAELSRRPAGPLGPLLRRIAAPTFAREDRPPGRRIQGPASPLCGEEWSGPSPGGRETQDGRAGRAVFIRPCECVFAEAGGPGRPRRTPRRRGRVASPAEEGWPGNYRAPPSFPCGSSRAIKFDKVTPARPFSGPLGRPIDGRKGAGLGPISGLRRSAAAPALRLSDAGRLDLGAGRRVGSKDAGGLGC